MTNSGNEHRHIKVFALGELSYEQAQGLVSEIDLLLAEVDAAKRCARSDFDA